MSVMWSHLMSQLGGLLSWSTVISGALAFQSQNALGQAKLLIGAERVMRVVPAPVSPPISLDDWTRAKQVLPKEAIASFDHCGAAIRDAFLRQ